MQTPNERNWPEPVQRVSAVLRAAAVDARIEEFAGGTPSAREAARAVGCELAQIVKSLVLVCDGAYVLALVPGDGRADEAAIARKLEVSEVRIARPDEVVHATGFEPGGGRAVPAARGDANPDGQELLPLRARLDRRRQRLAHGRDRAARAAAPLAARRRSISPPAGRLRRIRRPEKEPWRAGDREDLDERRARRLGRREASTSARTACTTARASSRASAATTPRRGRRSSGSATTCSGCTTRRSCSTWTSRTRSTTCATACNELIGANGLPECYIRPIAFYGYGELGVAARGNPVETVIMSWPWAPYLGEESLRTGIRAKISSLAARARRTSSRTSRRRPASTSTRCSR